MSQVLATARADSPGSRQCRPIPAASEIPSSQQATGDFNADGLRDVIFTTSSAAIPPTRAALPLPSPTEMAPLPRPVPINMGSTTISANFYGVTAGDLNGDGKDDIVAVAPASRSPGGIVVALSNGDGTFQPAKFVTIGVELDAVAIGDFNNDGKADLIVADAGGSSGTSQVTILYGDGAGNFDPSNSFVLQSGYDITTILAKDLNADGKNRHRRCHRWPDLRLLPRGRHRGRSRLPQHAQRLPTDRHLRAGPRHCAVRSRRLQRRRSARSLRRRLQRIHQRLLRRTPAAGQWRRYLRTADRGSHFSPHRPASIRATTSTMARST